MHGSLGQALLLVVFCLMAGGCTAHPQPYSPDAFYGDCLTWKGTAPCEAGNKICQSYQDVIVAKHPSAAACREACKKAHDDLFSEQTSLQACSVIVEHGSDLCEQQCLRQYPGQ
ncbi:hypothetical protein DFW101_3379 [Solidesulfovibrio carbinoliphilus subsp. oakridgensis]|uniref:Lipoprotein n=1 Tax=Solidesulfovibrio carbinoliphilus subsp. oakridgensis TaxID=694327 RepID=G7QBF4_9BACT|nr:hypothetical protein [Solidesulfovibrio carbinoliphilus]EHJ49377.1 hypothetical protein DFW101_3379 [Solidesulfovibrio carbinoliphilus subsp. oakridgensis]